MAPKPTTQSERLAVLETNAENHQSNTEAHFKMIEKKIDDVREDVAQVRADIAAVKVQVSKISVLAKFVESKAVIAAGIFIIMLAGAAICLFAMLGLDFFGQIAAAKEVLHK